MNKRLCHFHAFLYKKKDAGMSTLGREAALIIVSVDI
jgi:hypothetical protein